LTRVDPEWESKGAEAIHQLNLKDLRDAIRTELRLTTLTPDEFHMVKEGLREAARRVLVCRTPPPHAFGAVDDFIS
jgi:hypothetical protein